MKSKLLCKKTILFVVFFLLTIGNGRYIGDKLDNKVELLGLAVIIFSTVLLSEKTLKTLIEDVKIILFSIALSYGAFYNKISTEAAMMIFLSSILLMTYPKFSRLVVSKNELIKVIGDSLLIGMVVNSIIGIATGTLGLSFNSSSAIIKVLLPCGLKVKNYCGGIWMIVFISHYIYYYRNNKLRDHKTRFFILFILLLLSGSKGSCFLTIVFLISINFKKILVFKANQQKLFYSIVTIIVIIISIYVYNNIFINVPTYAYRIRGFNKLFDILTRDFSKFMFGISNIAYADTGFDYTINMRTYLGWEASIEMAYVNILIKNGFIGILIYIKIFRDIIKRTRVIPKVEKDIVICLLIIMILSGFNETYIASIHFVVGPAMFCLINGVACECTLKEEKCG